MSTLAEHLSIGEVAERTGVSVSALRFYEAEGMVTPTRSPGGQRRFPRDVLRRVAFIRVAQRVGLTLDEIRERARHAPRAAHADRGRLGPALARRGRRSLDERIRLLESVRDDLVVVHRLRLPVVAGVPAVQPGRSCTRARPGPALPPRRLVARRRSRARAVAETIDRRNRSIRCQPATRRAPRSRTRCPRRTRGSSPRAVAPG